MNCPSPKELPASLGHPVLEACAAPMVIFERIVGDCRIRYVNPAFVRRTGYSLAQIARMGSGGLYVDGEREVVVKRLCAAIRERRELDVPVHVQGKDGVTFRGSLHVSPVSDAGAGSPRYAVGVLREGAADVAYVSRLEREAHYDPLTGLPNRRLLAERAARAVAKAQRMEQPFGVAVIDLDGFKLVNDTLGHAAGDELLCAVGARLAHSLRAGDMVARVGGDEFVLLLEQPSHEFLFPAVVERARRSIEQPIHLHGRSFNIRGSIGLAVYPVDGEDLDTLLEHADRAMYQQKATGRSRKPRERSLHPGRISLVSAP